MKAKRPAIVNVILTTLGVCVVSIPCVHWYRQYERELTHQRNNLATETAYKADLEAALGRLKSKWLAEDRWDDDFTGQLTIPYSVAMERALVGKSSPLVFLGTVEDVRQDTQDDSIVRVRVYARKSVIRLHLSLTASQSQVDEISANQQFHQQSVGEFSKVCIFVATLDRIERIAARNGQNDDASYFVGHGILKDDYSSEVPAYQLPSVWAQ